MRVSIIVPTLNEESHIVRTIRSLQRFSSEKEIIVVDGGSTDQTVPLACAQNVLVLQAAYCHLPAVAHHWSMLRRFRYLCQAGRLSPDWRLPFSTTFRGSGLAPAIAPSRSFCPSELPDHNLLTALRTTQFRANVAALDDVATAVLVRSFTEMAFPLVPSRSSRERMKSLRREVLRKFGSNQVMHWHFVAMISRKLCRKRAQGGWRCGWPSPPPRQSLSESGL